MKLITETIILCLINLSQIYVQGEFVILDQNDPKTFILKKQTHHKDQKKDVNTKFLDKHGVLDDMSLNSYEFQLSKHENFYLAQIEVGTPQQSFQVLIDTGSPNLILTSTLCQQESCRKHGSYNPQLSSTSYYIEAIKLSNGEIGNEIDIQFATGSVEGVFFEDKVCLNDLCVENQLIIGVVEETEDIFSQMKFDGILGLGKISEAVVANASFLQNLKQKKKNFNNFSLYLSSYEDDEEYSSQLVLGGISQHLLQPGEQFKFFKVTTNHLWTISIRAIYLGNQRIDNCGMDFLFKKDVIKCQGLIDSGTSFISFSEYPMDIFIHKYGNYQACSNLEFLPDLTFVFDNDVEFSLTGYQYFRKNTRSFNNQDICIPYIKQSPIQSNEEQLFVLGQPFLTRHYVWFDEQQGRIGIAKSIQPKQY